MKVPFKGLKGVVEDYDPLGTLRNISSTAGIVRVGYRGFLSAVVALWKMNRGAKRENLRARFVVEVPLRWLR